MKKKSKIIVGTIVVLMLIIGSIALFQYGIIQLQNKRKMTQAHFFAEKGFTLLAQYKYKQAKLPLEKSFSTFKNTQEFKMRILLGLSLGKIYLHIGDYKKLEDILIETKKQFVYYTKKEYEYIYYFLMCKLRFHFKEQKDALYYAKKTLSVAEEIYSEDNNHHILAMVLYAKILYASNQHQKAVLVLKKAYSIVKKKRPEEKKSISRLYQQIQEWKN